MLRHGVGRGLATGWKTHHRTIITTTNSRRRLVEAPPPAFVQPKARNNIVQEVSPLPCRNVAVGRTTMQTRATTPHLFLFRRKFHSSSIVPNPWWARRFIKKRRKKRQEQKEKRNTNNHKHIIDGKPPLSPKNNNKIQKSWNERTHASNGRLVMTKQRMEEQLSSSGVLTKLVGPDGLLAKQVLHNIKAKMLFQQRIEHSHYDGMYFCNSYAIVDKSLLSSLPSAVTIVVDGEQEKEGDGMVELRATGMARRKKLGETFATVDLLLFLQECGVDLQNPPDQRAMRALEKTKQFQQELKQAQLLLELCRVSKPNFDTTTNNTNSTSTVTMLSHGTLITGEATANSKKEAENKALIQAAKNLDPDKIQQFQTFLEKSPAGHVAPLHISPLPEDSLKELQDAIGSLEDHNERMNRFAEIKEEFEQRYIARGGGARPNRGNPRNNSNDVNPSNHSERINAIFFQEEHRRKQKALEDKPNGKHAQMMSVRDALPIVQIKHTLLEALQTDPVLVVSGGTGSGKSTQCPQYILEEAIGKGRGVETRIVVTQPRRIAAISVAERVAAERGEKVGNSVGYSVRFNTVQPREAGGSIEFVTTGVLLRRLVNDPSLDGISHVMIDEVHERDIDTDFLLVLLKDVLTKKPDLRVILMSATLDAKSFGTFFSKDGSNCPVPVMSVPSKPRHPVEVIHLEDLAGELSTDTNNNLMKTFSSEMQELAKSLLEAHDLQLQLDLEEADAEEKAAARLWTRAYAEDEGEKLDTSGNSSSSSNEDSDSDSDSDVNDKLDGENPAVRRRTKRLETLRRAVSMRKAASDVDLSSVGGGYPNHNNLRKREIGEITIAMLAKIAQRVTALETDAGRKGSILCFLPGWDEIKAATEILEGSPRSLRSKMSILPLHSTIPMEDQHKVFEPAEEGNVKVILATNIAESSVTIDDVLCVIDSGLVREMYYDAESAMATMETVQTSRASATQRLGRAGRVAPGKCYRIYSRAALEAMLERPMPEIQRTALEATCLQTCSLTNDGVENFLSRAMDPPAEESVLLAMDHLVKLGAIKKNTGPDSSHGGESLTPLGHCLSRLPLDPAIGRMLIMGCVMNCLDPVLTAAACFSSRDIFYTPPQMRDEARAIRKSFSDTSDLMAKVNAYNELQGIIGDEGWASAREWASENFVSTAATSSIRSVRSQLLHELNRIGLVPKKELVNARGKNKQLREDASVNQNADNDVLYQAVWATGLPGNLSSRRRLSHFGTLRTRMEDHAGLHPSSVAFHRKPSRVAGAKTPRWFLYQEMVLSSQVFLRGCTALEPEQVFLFGGYLFIDKNNNSNTGDGSAEFQKGGTAAPIVLDDWIIVESQCQETINALSQARRELNVALDTKVMQPRKEFPTRTQYIIDTVSNLFENY